MQEELFFSGFLGKRVHLGVTGSVAAYKSLDLLRSLLRLGVSVSATLTNSATKFVSPLSFEALGADPVFSSMFDDGQDRYAHLSPGRTCDCFAVVPATANTMAKMAHGIADDMHSCQALSFPGPMVLAPAMNPNLWEAPATKDNLATLQHRGVDVVLPQTGDVACGDTGNGRLAESLDIIARILKAISPQDLQGRKVLITMGPTREPFDVARHWTNPSTGLMGGCLAVSAWLRGADVVAVSGPTNLTLPCGITTIPVLTAGQMHEAVMDTWSGCDIGCATAAVADFAPVPHGKGKFKKGGLHESNGSISFAFTRTPDILQSMGKSKTKEQQLIGFAAETEGLAEHGKDKLKRKNLDIIICNNIAQPESGFASPTNAVLVLDREGRSEDWPQLKKNEVAWRIWDHLLLLSK